MNFFTNFFFKNTSPDKNDIFNWIIVGLGNPGQEYDNTRHNIGFEAINFIAEKNNTIFKPNNNSLTAKLKIKNDTILLCKPLNFMNRSGSPIKYFLNKHQIDTEKLIVISDDVNLPLGKIRIRQGGSSGGHNGLKSIIKYLNTDNFIRIRIGIEKPSKISTTDYVLGKFKNSEKKSLEETIFIVERVSESLIIKGIQETMQNFN
jgi:PTH1 family peptidyl-tRNA hydrolase